MIEKCVLVVQQGARRNYCYASELEKVGLLHTLLTDAAWSGEPPLLAQKVFPGSMRRVVRGVARERLNATFVPNLLRPLRLLMHEEQKYVLCDEALALANRFLRLDDVRVVVNYQGNGGSLLERARRRGARIVTDFVVTPRYLEIEQAERERWPGWETQTTPAHVIRFYQRRIARLLGISDIYLCPSENVARDLCTIPGFRSERLRIVPYGSSDLLIRPPATRAGRVLFCGAAGLRKGIPYLAEAARLLKTRRPDICVAVAGPAPASVRQRPETSALHFLGVLDRDGMAEEFAKANVFCLPSLAEGSATSVYEALANGIPVVTTGASGSVVEDGLEGFVVAERDAPGLADAIESIVVDRALRQRMSQAALATAARYSDEACGAAFVAVIREIQGR